MSRNKKYYWMKLKEDFFEDDTIAWLEEQPNGKEYALFYLKLCLKSLKSDGVLIRRVGDMLIPYDVKMLAEMTRTDVDTAVVAMELLKRIKLVEILDNGEIFISAMEEMVGSETDTAIRVRKHRALKEEKRLALQCNTDETKTKQKCTPEIEKEKEIEKEIEKEKIYTSDSAEFFVFWKEYPNKKNKQTAMGRWDKLKVTAELYEKIMEGLKRAKNSMEWAENDGKYIPHPASWLNAGGWENEYRPKEESRKAAPRAAAAAGNDALAMRRMLREG